MRTPLIRRELASRPGRWLLIAAAVFVAVAFSTAAFGFARSVRGLVVPTASAVTASLPLGTVVVTPRVDGLTTATALDDALLDRIGAVDGVGSATGSFDQPVGFRMPRGAGPDRPSVLRGVVFSSTTSDRWELIDGRFPTGPQEVALDLGGLVVVDTFLGDVRALQVPLGTLDVSVVGLVRPVNDGAGSSPASEGDRSVSLAAANVVLDPQFAPLLLDAEGRVDRITVVPSSGVDPEALAPLVRAVVSDQLRVIAVTTPQAVQQAAVTGIDGGISAATYGYAVISLLMGALVIANAESVLVAQRTRELALLRAVGASRRQLVRLVVGESVAVGAMATIVATLAGATLAQWAARAVRSDVARPWQLSGEMVVAGVVVGLVVSVLGALAPALRAGRVSPLDALSDSRAGADRVTRPWPSMALFLAGAGGSVVALTGGVGGGLRIAVGGIGVLAALVGVAGLSRAIVVPLAALAGAVAAPAIGVTARVGLGNARRQPSRTAGAASTLMVGLALTAAVGVVGASARQAIVDQVGSNTDVDLYAQRRGVVRVSARAVDEILSRRRLGIRRHLSLVAVDGVVDLGGPSGATTVSATATDLSQLDGLVEVDLAEGSLPDRADQAAVLVSQRVADETGVAVGDQVTLRSTSGRDVQLRVAGLHRDTSFVGPVVVARSAAESVKADGTFEQAAMRLESWGSPRWMQRRIDRNLAQLPKVGVSTPAEWGTLRTTVVDTSLRIIAVLLAGALGMGFLGLGVTQGLSVVERRRELRLLWSVGAQRHQLRSMISMEAVFVAVLASLVGLGAGGLIGWVGMSAAPESLGGRHVVPVGAMALVAVAAVVVSWGVARVVARRTLD